MPAASNCSVCGKPLTPGRLRGLCAACLVRGVKVLPASADPADGAMFRIPGHDVLEEIARGGMGIVYRARQHDPAREVALKMLLPGGATAAMRERFRIEARTMAELDHPGVLPLYQFGEHGGTPWFTMKLASGGSLAERLQRPDRTGPRAAAELMAGLAEAVAYAHQRGVLHRDLKPGNVLFDSDGRAYVADFGLAKLDSVSQGGLTHSRAMLGTPHYLAPELAQKAGTTATVATEVYALGAMLYELLAGRPPFLAETLAGLLRSIVEDDPPSLLAAKTTHSGLVPRGLAAIAGKAMAKEPARRYRDAAALAADLRAWLAGEAIEARPPAAREKFLRWVRRHPAWAASLVLLTTGAGVVILLQANAARELRGERDVAAAAEQAALMAKAEALTAQVAAARAGGRIDGRDAALEAAREAAALRVTEALRDDAITLLASPGWRDAGRLVLPSGGAQCYSSDLAWSAAVQDGTLALRELSTGAEEPAPPPPAELAFQPVSAIHAADGAGTVTVWSRDPAHPQNRGAFLSYTRLTKQWSVTAVHDKSGSGLVWHNATGRYAAVSAAERRTMLYSGGREFPAASASAVAAAFSPDGSMLALTDTTQAGAVILEICDAAPERCGARRYLVELPPQGTSPPVVLWRGDGGAAAVVSGRTEVSMVYFDGTETLVERLGEHSAAVHAAAWHPSGEWLATAAADGTVRLWETAARREILRLPVHASRVAFSGDGSILAIWERWAAGMVRYAFRPPAAVRQRLLPRRVAGGDSAAMMPPWSGSLTDDGTLAVATGQSALEWMDTGTGQSAGRGPYGSFWKLAMNSDSLLVLGTKGSGPVSLWQHRIQLAPDGAREVGPPRHLVGSLATFAASQDLTRIAVEARAGKPLLLQTANPREGMSKLSAAQVTPGFSALSPDARWRAVSAFADSGQAGLAIWDTSMPEASPRILSDYPPGAFGVFSPDSATLYVHSDHGLTALTTGAWQVRWHLPRRNRSFSMNLVALSGDGSLLAVAEAPRGLALHDPETGRRLALLSHPDLRPFGAIALNRDGSVLLATGLPSSMQVWHLRTLREELAKLGLDWAGPAFAPAASPNKPVLRIAPEPGDRPNTGAGMESE